jgi:hypothetical protein
VMAIEAPIASPRVRPFRWVGAMIAIYSPEAPAP